MRFLEYFQPQQKVEWKFDEWGYPMVKIPGGQYKLGDSQNFSREIPTLWVDALPVSYHQYALFIQSGKYGDRNYWDIEIPPPDQFLKRIRYDHSQRHTPITNITWHEAYAYARGCNKRLLNEYEWEIAARGSHKKRSPKQQCREYISDLENKEYFPYFKDTSCSDFGCFGFIGNCYEWCGNWYADQYNAIDKADKFSSNNRRVVRGGHPSTRETIYHRSSGFLPGHWAQYKGGELIAFRCCSEDPNY